MRGNFLACYACLFRINKFSGFGNCRRTQCTDSGERHFQLFDRDSRFVRRNTRTVVQFSRTSDFVIKFGNTFTDIQF